MKRGGSLLWIVAAGGLFVAWRLAQGATTAPAAPASSLPAVDPVGAILEANAAAVVQTQAAQAAGGVERRGRVNRRAVQADE